MTDTNSLDFDIDTSDFATPLEQSSGAAIPLVQRKEDQPTFSQRAAQMRAAARQAVASETTHVVEVARAKLAEAERERQQELGQAQQKARASTLKASIVAALVAAATVVSGVWAVQQASTDIELPASPIAALEFSTAADDEAEQASADQERTQPSPEQAHS